MIKEGELFLYTDLEGHIPPPDLAARPLLPRHALPEPAGDDHRRPPARPSVLHGGTRLRCSMEFANLQIKGVDGRTIPQATVHVRRTRLVSDRLYELLRVKNFNPEPVEVSIEIASEPTSPTCSRCAATPAAPRHASGAARRAPSSLAYLGLDDVLRKTVVSFAARRRASRARTRVPRAPGATRAQGDQVLRRGAGAGRAGARRPTSTRSWARSGATTSAGSPSRATSSPTTSSSRRCCAAPSATCACCLRARATGAWSWPGCRGSWRRWGATRFSPASRR